MSKRIYKLTEISLKKIINNAVMKVISESKNILSQDKYIEDIKEGEIEEANISFINTTYDEVTLNATGKSGTEYNITASIDGKWNPGLNSTDYDMPNDNPQTEENIDDIKIEFYDTDNEEWINLPYNMQDESFNELIANKIYVDWSEYNPEADFYED